MRWMTRERPRVSRIGCAWLITRYVDTDAEFLFATGADLPAEAARLGATLFHVEGSGLSRQGDQSSFEVLMRHYRIEDDPALALLARIVNTADIKTSPYGEPAGAGLRAICDGLLLVHHDDHAVLSAGMAVYDALYAYCRSQVERRQRNGGG